MWHGFVLHETSVCDIFFDWNYYFCHHIYRELDDWKGEGVRY